LYTGNKPLKTADPFGLFDYYGNWCGSNHSGGYDRPWDQLTPDEQQNAEPPIDDLDTCCQTHDKCYASCRDKYPCSENERLTCLKNCDRELAECASNAENGGFRRLLLIGWMSGSTPFPGPNDPGCPKR
jgi:hypothetical protein